MPVEVFANTPSCVAAGTSGTTVPASGTSETWTMGAGYTSFPTASPAGSPPTQFHIADPAAISEVILVTGGGGGTATWTVTRGAEGTTPVAHAAGATFVQTVTAGALGTFLETVNWLNVKTAYGAKGDGTADDTAAVQAAITAAGAGAGGTVYFPAGTYKISAALTMASYVTLAGDGDNASVIKQTSTTANALTGTDITRAGIRDLQFLGPASGSGKGIAFGLSAHTNTGFLDFRDVWVQGFGSDGISIATPIVSSFTRVVSQSNGGNGWTVTSATSSTSCAWNSCYANANTGYGYSLTAQCYSSLNGCAADGNASGYYLSGCQSVALNGCGCEASTADGFVLTGGYGNTLNSCRVYTNNHYGIHVTGGEKACTLIGAVDNTPGAGAVNFIITDAGTSSAIINDNNVTANSLASGTASTLADASGEFAPAGIAYLNAANVYGLLAGYAAVTAGVVTLTYSSSITPDASAGNHFRVILTGNPTINVPSNPADGQKITFELIQDATGSRTVTWAAGYDFGGSSAPALTTTASKRDLAGFVYSASAAKWLYAGIMTGF